MLGDHVHPGDQPSRVDRRAPWSAGSPRRAGARRRRPRGQSECRRAIRAQQRPVRVRAARPRAGPAAVAVRRLHAPTPRRKPGPTAWTPPAPLSSRGDEHLRGHRRRRLPRLAPLRAPARRGPPGDLRRQPRHRLAAEHRAHPRRRLRLPQRTTSPSRSTSTSRSTSSTTSPRRRARSTTCGCRCTRSRSAPTAPTTCSAWPSASAPASCSPRPPRSTATRRSTRSRRATGATSTRSARAASTTRRSATPRR